MLGTIAGMSDSRIWVLLGISLIVAHGLIEFGPLLIPTFNEWLMMFACLITGAATIWGTVRVAVKVHVDSAGNVASAELNSPGPSKFFADKALQAAKNWDFVPAKLDGHNVASEWIIRFHFTQSDTKVYPAEATP